LAFFAFFAFFAFLAIVSSQGYNGLNATREACSAEGQPRNILKDKVQQIRSRLPRIVTQPSSRYPQLLCISGLVSRKLSAAAPQPRRCRDLIEARVRRREGEHQG
jgi:hypothetical protein